MASMTNWTENKLIDATLRGGSLTTAGAAGSSTVVDGIRTFSTAYTAGQVVVPHASDTGAGGKYLMCTTAGTTSASGALAIGNPGATHTDGSVTWTVMPGMPVFTKYDVALFRATAGKSPRSTAVTSGQTTVPATSNGRMYRCTTGGTTGASEPTWGTTNGGTTSDGTAVWTEMTPDFEAYNATVQGIEVSGGSYARVAVSNTLANWAGTQSAASTTASSGTAGLTSNNATITFATPSADWQWVAFVALMHPWKANTCEFYGALTIPKYINSGDAVSFAAATMSLEIDN